MIGSCHPKSGRALIPLFFNIIDKIPTVTCSPDVNTKSLSTDGFESILSK